MALKDVVKVSRKTFINPRAWLGYDAVKESSQGFWAIMRSVFARRTFEPAQKETFQQAVTRFNLNEKDVSDIQFTYLAYAILFLIIGLGMLGYSIWLLIEGHFLAFLLGLATVVLLAGQAFRYHFWYFQVKHQKLGCTFEEWKSGKIHKGDNAP